MIACERGILSAVLSLLSHEELDVDIQTREEGLTACMLACEQGHVDIVTALVDDQRPDLRIQDKVKGSTLLSFCPPRESCGALANRSG